MNKKMFKKGVIDLFNDGDDISQILAKIESLDIDNNMGINKDIIIQWINESTNNTPERHDEKSHTIINDFFDYYEVDIPTERFFSVNPEEEKNDLLFCIDEGLFDASDIHQMGKFDHWDYLDTIMYYLQKDYGMNIKSSPNLYENENWITEYRGDLFNSEFYPNHNKDIKHIMVHDYDKSFTITFASEKKAKQVYQAMNDLYGRYSGPEGNGLTF